MPASCQQALPPGPSDVYEAYPLLSCLACHAFLRFVLGLLVCWCFCDRFVALSLLLFFSAHQVTCGRASTVGQPVRTPCRQ